MPVSLRRLYFWLVGIKADVEHFLRISLNERVPEFIDLAFSR
jgi:hypothetical protein